MSRLNEAGRKEALAFYRTVQSYEAHFNQLEFEVRKIASAWLLASFAALAFLLRGDLDDSTSLVGTFPLVVLVCTLAQIGLFLMWILDQVVYHGLLDAAFTAALRIEARFPELVPLRSLMLRISAGTDDGRGGIGMARYLRLFYLLPMLAFATIAWWAIVRAGGGIAWPWIGVALVCTGLPLWVLAKTRKIDLSRERNRAFGQSLGTSAGYNQVVDAWLARIEAGDE